jgi:uncharacterized protein (DUF302 family)
VTVAQIEHVRVWTEKSFAEVVQRLEAVTGLFDPAQIKEAIVAGKSAQSIMATIEAMAGESGFMRVAAWDHGSLLRALGQPANAMRYVIGHPLIAARMMRRDIGSGLYAPLSLLVAGDPNGDTHLEYDRPSTLFKQFEDDIIAKVALELDEKLAALISSLTGVSVSNNAAPAHQPGPIGAREDDL